MSDTVFNRTNAENYLKTTYGPAGVVILNSRTPTLKRMSKPIAKFGKAFEESVELSIGVGVGAGEYYPDAGVEKVERVSFEPKRMYATGVIDRLLARTAVGRETAFIDSQKHKFKRAQEGFAWNVERMLYTLSTAGLGTVDSVVDTDPIFAVTITSASWKQYNFEVGIKLNFGSNTEKFTITAVNRSTRVVTVTRDSGVYVPAASDVVYMQNSKDNEIVSIPDVLKATSGTLYGITVQDRWQAHQQSNVAQTIDEELIDNAVLDTQDITGATEGDSITDIVVHNKQWKILKSQQVGLKTYVVPNSNVPKQLRASLGLTALQYFSPVHQGPTPIYTSRFMLESDMFGLNMKRMMLKLVHNPMFFDDDGGILRKAQNRRDEWEFVYGAYGENYMYPAYHFWVGGLT